MIAGQFIRLVVDVNFVNVVLIFALIVSLYTDIRHSKILNLVTMPAAGAGMVYHTVSGGFSGFGWSFKGMCVGLALLLIPFLMGGIGAGDVKLLGAVGALKGSVFVLYAGLASAVAGGIIVLFLLICRGIVTKVLTNMAWGFAIQKSSFLTKGHFVGGSFPYGIAIVVGTVFTLLTGWNTWVN